MKCKCIILRDQNFNGSSNVSHMHIWATVSHLYVRWSVVNKLKLNLNLWMLHSPVDLLILWKDQDEQVTNA